jgi:hypothetical protein
LAEEYGVSPKTIERDAAFARAVDTITCLKDTHFRDALMRGYRPTKETPNGERELTRVELVEIAGLLEARSRSGWSRCWPSRHV